MLEPYEVGSKQMSREEILTEEAPVAKLPTECKGNAEGSNNASRKVDVDSYAFNHFPGLPHFVRNIRPFGPHQSYVRSLFAAGHGYPMYDPVTVSMVPDDYKDVCGIRIGDVGVLSEQGEFAFGFNIFLPSDHPYNKGNTPDSFTPLEPLDDSEIHTSVEFFPRGSVITSKGIIVTRHSESPLNISFRSSERIGGVLVLPEGATRQDTSTARIHQYVARYAQEWAFFFAQSRWHPSRNGSTYVVTGVDKTSDCATMAFQVGLNDSPKIIARYENNALFAFDGISAVRNEIRPKAVTRASDNLCVFLRGIRIGVGRAEWIENTEELPENAEFTTPYTELYFPPPWFTSIKSKLCFWGAHKSDLPAFTFFPHPFHPSDIIVSMMLSLRPDAPLALVDDLIEFINSNKIMSIKGSLERSPLNLSCSKGASFEDFRMMVEELFEFHDIVEHEGVLRLARNSKQKIGKVSWLTSVRYLLWPVHRSWANRGFTELVRKGQHHMDTNRYLPIEYSASRSGDTTSSGSD